MKRFLFIIATILSLVIVGMTVYSCQKTEPLIPEPEPQDVLTIVSPGDKVVIMSEGETISVKLKTNCNWTASTDADWLSLSRVSGTTSLSEFDITVRPNRGEDRREASVTLKAGSKTVEIAITQLPHVDVPTDLKVTESYELGYEGETIRIEFSTNKEWLVVATEPWIVVSPSSGTDKETFFDLTVGENPGVEPRSGYLTVTASDKSAVVSVTQAGNPNAESHIDIDGSLSFGYEGGPLTVDFTTNKDWTVSTEADWLTLDPVSGTPESASFKVIASGNGEATKRTAEIVVAAGEKTVKVSVEQDAAPADGGLRVEGNGNVSWEDSSITVNVKSSTDWHVQMVKPVEGGIYWSHIVGDEWPYDHGVDHKASDTSFEITYGDNSEYQSRTMTYIITAGDKTAYFVLCQGAYPVTELSVTDRDVVFGPKADSFTLNFKSSYAWTASANVPWITLSATEGVPETGEHSTHPDGCHFDISVPDYDRGVKRVGTVTISSGGKTVNVTVTQMGVEVVEFEDALFKEYCLQYDTNHDGELDTKEAQAITDIDISLMPVTSVKGMESMPNLKAVEARYCKLKYIDFTKLYAIERFNFNDNEVTGVLDFSNCPHLTGIAADNNRVTGLIFKDNRLFEGFELANNCLSGVLDLTETSDDAYFFGLCGNPDLKEVIVKDEKFIKAVHCDEGVKITVRH